MDLVIRDNFWGINRRTGEYSESLIEEITFYNIELNQELEVSRLIFVVSDISEEVELTIKINGKKIVVKKDQTSIYRPTSFDAGHFYEFTLK